MNGRKSSSRSCDAGEGTGREMEAMRSGVPACAPHIVSEVSSVLSLKLVCFIDGNPITSVQGRLSNACPLFIKPVDYCSSIWNCLTGVSVLCDSGCWPHVRFIWIRYRGENQPVNVLVKRVCIRTFPPTEALPLF